MSLSARPFRAAVLASLACAALLAGCSNRTKSPSAPVLADPMSVPLAAVRALPTGAGRTLDGFRRSIQGRDIAGLGRALTGDFLFGCDASDTAGAVFRSPIGREEFMSAFSRLFAEVEAEAPAARISFQWTSPLRDLPDPRPGRDPRFHRLVLATSRLVVAEGVQVTDIRADQAFFLARGDSAQVPPELAAAGETPDPNRWFIERIEDGSGNDAIQQGAPPAVRFGWCGLFARFR